MHIAIDDPRLPDVTALLNEHLQSMQSISKPESKHALDIEALCTDSISFLSARAGNELLGCGALMELDPSHGEIKSMRTASMHLRKGVAAAILEQIITLATQRRYTRLSLETGSQPEFIPACKLYERFGFERCEPFGSYTLDPSSVFMTREL